MTDKEFNVINRTDIQFQTNFHYIDRPISWKQWAIKGTVTVLTLNFFRRELLTKDCWIILQQLSLPVLFLHTPVILILLYYRKMDLFPIQFG